MQAAQAGILMLVAEWYECAHSISSTYNLDLEMQSREKHHIFMVKMLYMCCMQCCAGYIRIHALLPEMNITWENQI